MIRNGKVTATSYAEQFKPALILGAQTLSDLANNSYLQEKKEGYDSTGMPILYANDTPAEPNLNSLYRFDTLQTNVKPSVRQVEVSGKTDFTTFLIELQDGSTGLNLVMLQESNGMVFCNLRLLPFSSLSQLINTTGSSGPGLLRIKLPTANIIKLNITLKASNVGEILYQTHKTEIALDDLSDEDNLKLKAKLELEAAKTAAHYVSQMVALTSPDPATDNSNKSKLQVAAIPKVAALTLFALPDITKKLVLGCTLVATSVGAIVSTIGILTASPLAALSGTVLSSLGAFGRNVVGLSGGRPIQDGDLVTMTQQELDRSVFRISLAN